MEDVEVPGCCPLCGQGKLVLSEFSFSRDTADLGSTWLETAVLWCGGCGASIKAHGRQTNSALWNAYLAAEDNQKERFRETIGGFQFTD